MIAQVGIMIFGASAIWLVGRKENWRKWGYLLGLCSQPFWIYSSINNEQWGILVMTLFYTYSWCQGIYNFWIDKDLDVDRLKKAAKEYQDILSEINNKQR